MSPLEPCDEALVSLDSDESMEEEIIDLKMNWPSKDTMRSYKDAPKNPPNTPRTPTDWPSIDFGD